MVKKRLGEIRDALIRAPNWIGDAVLCLPAIDTLKKGFPNLKISVLAKPWVAPIFLNNPYVSDIIEYDATKRHRGMSGKWRLINELRKRSFGIAILFQNAFEAALITLLAGIPERLGYATDGRGPLLTKAVKPGDKNARSHQVDYYLGLVRALGLDSNSDRCPILYVMGSEKRRAETFLQGGGIAKGRPIVGIAPGSAYGPAKQWPAERFSQVANRLFDDYGMYAILFGGKGDKEVCALVEKGMETDCMNLSGATTLREAMAIISRCNLFITNDSGLMHVSAAIGVFTIAIFGSTNPNLTGPIGKRCIFVYKGVECSPCYKRKCPTDFKCMYEVTADDVMDGISKIIGVKAL